MVKTLLKQVDLVLTVLLTLLSVLFIFVPSLNDIPVRLILGLLLVFFLPGYSLIMAVFPRNDDLDGIEKVALSIGLSVAIVPLIGLVLNYTPFGIRVAPLLVVLSTFTISLSLVALFIRLKLPIEERFRVPFERLFKAKEFLGEKVWEKVLSVILVTFIITSSAVLFYVIVKPKMIERSTEFYLLGSNGKASNYPIDLKFGEEGKVIIGIVNNEYENVVYHLEINFNGSLIHKENVFLIEAEKWERSFTFKATKKGENQKLEFLLYKDQQIEAYRTLHIWVRIT